MIPRHTMRAIVILAILAAASFWLARGDKDGGREPIPGLDTRLDYALHEFEARYYDAEGRPAVRVWAPTLTNNASSGIGTIERPRFRVVQEGDPWSIVAESATVTADREHILLQGAVRMLRREPGSADRLEVSTSEMTLDVTPRLAHSDRPVVILDGGNTLEAVGFRIDMINDSFHLENRVKGRYVLQ